jgi:hypothetical protein
MNKFIRIGVDLGKNHCQVHALEGEGSAAVKRKLSRSKMRDFSPRARRAGSAWRPAAQRIIARELIAMGYDVVLMPLAFKR